MSDVPNEVPSESSDVLHAPPECSMPVRSEEGDPARRSTVGESEPLELEEELDVELVEVDVVDVLDVELVEVDVVDVLDVDVVDVDVVDVLDVDVVDVLDVDEVLVEVEVLALVEAPPVPPPVPLVEAVVVGAPPVPVLVLVVLAVVEAPPVPLLALVVRPFQPPPDEAELLELLVVRVGLPEAEQPAAASEEKLTQVATDRQRREVRARRGVIAGQRSPTGRYPVPLPVTMDS